MITAIPELSHPLPSDEAATLSLHEKVAAMFKTTEFLEAFGTPSVPTEEDRVRARAAFHESIEAAAGTTDPTKIPAKVSALTTPASVGHLKEILSEYDHVVVKSAVQIRTFVTNRLIEESTNPDAKIRMRALELLGKIGDVGLFVERTEVTVKHKTTIELQSSIKERITKLLQAKSAREQQQEITDVQPKAVSLREATDQLLDAADSDD
jgi:hypothetical protein